MRVVHVFGIKDKSFFNSIRPAIKYSNNGPTLNSFSSARKDFRRLETKSKYYNAYTLKNLSDGYNLSNAPRSISKGTTPVTH